MKRVLSLVLALVMVLGMIPTFAAEMTGGEQLLENGFITGKPGDDVATKLDAGAALTRQELAALIAELMGEKEIAAVFAQPADYADADMIASWAVPYVAYAQVNGWMTGKGENFDPLGPVPQQQLAAVLLNALGYTVDSVAKYTTAVADLAALGVDVAAGDLNRGQAFEAMWVAVSEVNVNGEEQTLGVKLGKLDPPVVVPTALEVASIVALNNKQIDIMFNKAVDATEAVKLTNYTVGLQGALSTNVADGAGAKAVVLEDGMTVRLTLENGANFVNSTTTNKVVVKKEIGMEADVTKADLAVLDTTVPGIESVKTTGPKQITITFTEPMDRSVVAASTVSSFTLNNGTVTLDPTKATYVDADRTLTLETYITIPEAEHTLTVKAPASNNMKDYAGYQLPATSIAFTHVKDTTAPTATLVSNTETTATIKFNKVVSDVDAANVLFRHTYNSGTYQVTGAAGATNPSGDGMTWVINFGITMPFPPGASTLYVAYNSATGTLITDNYGNEFAATSFTLNTVVDNTKPEVVSVTFKTATTLEVLFSETVDATTAETEANYVLKDTAATPATITVSNAVLGVDNKTVTLTTATMNGGSYNLTVKNVKDASLAANAMVEVTVGFTANDTIAPIVVDKDTVTVGTQIQQVATDKVRVEFSEAMNKASIENKANWKYNGLALPSTATVVAADDLKSVVITIDGLNIANDITLGVVTDASGLAIAAFSTTLEIVAVANIDADKVEIIAKNQIVVKFDELIVGATTTDFQINNGGWAAPTAISVAVVDGKTQITLTPAADITDTTGTGIQVRTVTAVPAAGAAANAKNTFGTPVEIAATNVDDKYAPIVVTNGYETQDIDADGKIDHVKITFSEDMQAGLVSADKFTVAGYTVVDAYAVSAGAPTSATARTGATVGNGAVVWVRVTEKTTADGGAKPVISIAAGLKDVPGNAFAAVTEKASVDKVLPVIISAVRTGANAITLTFSEAVYANNDATGALVAADISHSPLGDLSDTEAMAGLTHTAGATTATATTTTATVAATSTVGPAATSVYDAAGNVAATFANGTVETLVTAP